GDVALVDRRRLDRAVWPSDHVACANLRRPPVERVRREHPGSKRITDGSPDVASSRSMLAWSAAMGLGCRKNGCGVWCSDDRKTTHSYCATQEQVGHGAVSHWYWLGHFPTPATVRSRPLNELTDITFCGRRNKSTLIAFASTVQWRRPLCVCRLPFTFCD